MVKLIGNVNGSAGGDIPGVDRHYYERQVPASSPFGGDNAFALATARAKDEARHLLIKAIQKADEDARLSSFTGLGGQSITEAMSVSMSIDGRDQARLNDIEL